MKHITFIRIGFLALCACILALVIHSIPVYTVYEDPHLQSLQTQGKWERFQLDHPVEFGTRPAPDAAVVADGFWIPRELVIREAKSFVAGMLKAYPEFPFSELDMQYNYALGCSEQAVLYCEAERAGITLEETDFKHVMWAEQARKRWAIANDYTEEELEAYLNGMQMTEEEYIVSDDETQRKYLIIRTMEDRWYDEFLAEQPEALLDWYEQHSAWNTDKWKEERCNRLSACFLIQHVQCHLGDQ